jgi:hydroxyethylthiazole kinase-like uncharacterized protein yjeF
MMGAAVLSGLGALRSGAGLVTMGVPVTEQAAVSRRIRPEAMVLGLKGTRQGALAASAWSEAAAVIRRRKMTVVAAGPGLTVNPQTRSLLLKLLSLRSLPIVLDADALNNLAGQTRRLDRRDGWPTVITPHPGEMGRLLGLSTLQVQADRVGRAVSLAQRSHLICVLKGDRTVVTDGRTSYINTTGNPGMAKGGSGDVLTGILAGFLAQRVSCLAGASSFEKKRAACLEASAAAVFLHGLAGDIAARTHTQRGLLAMDIGEALPAAIRRTAGAAA